MTRLALLAALAACGKKDTAITILTAWRDPDGSRYFTCQADLGTPVNGLADAFEKACSNVSGD